MRYLKLLLLLLAAFPALAGAVPAPALSGLDDELIYRINFGRSDDVVLLLGKGANANARSEQGDPALSLAVGRNDAEAVKMVQALLGKGANPSATDHSGNIPIVVAARNGQGEMIAALIARGADYTLTTTSGATLAEIARASSNPDAAKPIEKALSEQKAYDDSLHTAGRFRSLIHRYAYQSCRYQYWLYFLSSGQNPKADEGTQKNIDDGRLQIRNLVIEIQKYYPLTRASDLERLAHNLSEKLVASFDHLVSNRNRERHGIGTQKDVDERCGKLSDEANINYMR